MSTIPIVQLRGEDTRNPIEPLVSKEQVTTRITENAQAVANVLATHIVHPAPLPGSGITVSGYTVSVNNAAKIFGGTLSLENVKTAAIQGGWQEVSSIAERDAITAERLAVGMAVYVTSSKQAYILDSVTPKKWSLLVTGGTAGPGAYEAGPGITIQGNVIASTSFDASGIRVKVISDYFSTAEYAELDYDYAKSYYAGENAAEIVGGCSSVRNGNFYGRNYDWEYSEDVVFSVRTPNKNDRYATVGICTLNGVLTKDTVHAGSWMDEYKVLPFHMLDGINEKGVVANVNVVPTPEGHETTVALPAVRELDRIPSQILVRYILDNFDSARSAAEYIRDYIAVVMSSAMHDRGYEVHVMVADAEETWLIEFWDNGTVIYDMTAGSSDTMSGKPYMTNFHLGNVSFSTIGSKEGQVYTPATQDSTHNAMDTNNVEAHGAGLERYNIIADGYQGTGTLEGMRALMSSLYYTNAYTDFDLTGAWHTEFVGTYGATDITVKSSVNAFITVMAAAKEIYTKRTRTAGDYYGTWQTVSSCVYDIEKRIMYLVTQQGASNSDIYTDGHSFSVAQPSDIIWRAGTGEYSAITKANQTSGWGRAGGKYSVAEGFMTIADGDASHAEGNFTTIAPDARDAHTEGYRTVANNVAEHAEGRFNYSHKNEYTPGEAGRTQHSIGVGTDIDERKNAIEVMQNGDVYVLGIGGYNGSDIHIAGTLQNELNATRDYTAWEVLATDALIEAGSFDDGNGNELTTEIVTVAPLGTETTAYDMATFMFRCPLGSGTERTCVIRIINDVESAQAKTAVGEVGWEAEPSSVDHPTINYLVGPGEYAEYTHKYASKWGTIKTDHIIYVVTGASPDYPQQMPVRVQIGVIDDIPADKNENFRLYVTAGQDSTVFIDWGDGQIDRFQAGDARMTDAEYEAGGTTEEERAAAVKTFAKYAPGSSAYSFYLKPDELAEKEFGIYCRHEYQTAGKYKIKVYGPDFSSIRHYQGGHNIVYRALASDLPLARCHTNQREFLRYTNRMVKLEVPQYTIGERLTNVTAMVADAANLQVVTGMDKIPYVTTCSQLFMNCPALSRCDFKLPQTLNIASYTNAGSDGYRNVFYHSNAYSCTIVPLCGDLSDFFPRSGFTIDHFDIRQMFYTQKKTGSDDNRIRVYPYITLNDGTAAWLAARLWNDYTKTIQQRSTNGTELVGVFYNIGDAYTTSLIPQYWGGSVDIPVREDTSTIAIPSYISAVGDGLVVEGGTASLHLSLTGHLSYDADGGLMVNTDTVFTDGFHNLPSNEFALFAQLLAEKLDRNPSAIYKPGTGVTIAGSTISASSAVTTVGDGLSLVGGTLSLAVADGSPLYIDEESGELKIAVLPTGPSSIPSIYGLFLSDPGFFADTTSGIRTHTAAGFQGIYDGGYGIEITGNTINANNIPAITGGTWTTTE